MLFSNPRVLPILMMCIGIGIIAVRGPQIEKFQDWGPQDIDTAVELNLALDMVRSGPDITLTEAQQQARKEQIRAEIMQSFVLPQQKMREEYRQGYWIAGIGFALFILVLLLQQRGLLKKA